MKHDNAIQLPSHLTPVVGPHSCSSGVAVAAAVCSLILMPWSVSALPLNNGSFESPVLPSGSIATGITPAGWSVGSSSLSPLMFRPGTALGWPAPAAGDQYAAISSSFGPVPPAGVTILEQAFTVTTAGDYVLAWSDNAALSVAGTPYTVSILGGLIPPLSVSIPSRAGSPIWRSHSAPVTLAAGSYTLSFKSVPGAGTTLLDGVSLTAVSIPNVPPLAADDSYSISEDTTLGVAAPGLLGNDTDPEGGPLTAILAAPPASGVLALHTDGSFEYTPNLNFYGVDTFRYRASDGVDVSAEVMVTIVVSAVNDRPRALPQTVSTLEDSEVAVTLAAVDPDDDAATLSYVVLTGPLHGTLSGSPPNLIYAPALNYHGPDSVTYRVRDAALDSTPATVEINVISVNDAPVAHALSVSGPKNTSISGGVTGADVDGPSALTFSAATLPAHGLLVMASDGSFIYTPNTDYTGPDSFIFRASDGVAFSTATVSVTVLPENHPPVAVLEVSPDANLDEGDPTILVIAANGVDAKVTLDGSRSFDPDGDSLEYDWSLALPGGTIVLLGQRTSPIITPTAGIGTYDMMLQVSDGMATSARQIKRVTVIPVADVIAELIRSIEAAGIRSRSERTLVGLLEFDRDLFAGRVVVPGMSACVAGVAWLGAFNETVQIMASNARTTRVTAALAAEWTAFANEMIRSIRCD